MVICSISFRNLFGDLLAVMGKPSALVSSDLGRISTREPLISSFFIERKSL